MPPHIMFRVFFGLPTRPANDDHPGGDRVSGKSRHNDDNSNNRLANRDGRDHSAEKQTGAVLPVFLGSRLALPHGPEETGQPATGAALTMRAAARSRAHLTMIDGSRG